MANRLRAKFVVSSIKHVIGPDGKPTAEEFESHAVYGQNGSENAQWSKYTPTGNLRMTITNESAFGSLPIGTEFYLDLVPASETAQV